MVTARPIWWCRGCCEGMAPLKVTLDTQCINDLLERPDFSPPMDKCLQLASEGRLEIGIPAICGSENLPDYMRPDSFSIFLEKLVAVGLSDTNLHFPIGYRDLTFWDHCISGDQAALDLEQKIHGILFPTHNYDPMAPEDFADPLEYDKHRRQWINRKCDVLVAWTHIHYGRNVLLTRDTNFMKQSKLPQLIALGAGRVVSPSDFITGFA